MKLDEWTQIHDYCMSRPCAYESRPFGEYPICYRVAGKIFAQLNINEDWYKITLKTNPDAADFYRQTYPGIVVRGYHCPPVQQPYWNTIELYQFRKEDLFHMIDEAYDEIVSHLTKKDKKRLLGLKEFTFEKNTEDKDIIKVYLGDKIIASGAYIFYDDQTIEIHNIIVSDEYRERGIGREVLRRLEADARIAGFRYAILSIDESIIEAENMCKRNGYKIMDSNVQYTDDTGAVCMKKKL